MNSLNLKGHFSEETKNATTIKNSQVIFDTSSLLSDIRNIIHGPGLKVPVELEHNVSILQTLCYGMQRLFDAINYRPAGEIAIREELEFKTYITFHRKICLKLAETLMYLPQFSSLAKSDKANLFNTLLPFFLSIERVYSSLLVFGHDNPKTLILFDDVQGYDERFAILSDAELPENSKKQLFSLFRNCNEFLLNKLYLPLKKLKLTITEFSFFIGLFLFSVEDIVDITDELREAGSRAIQLINNDIHNYYCKNRTDYAHRITEIVRLISKATCYCSMKGETISVAQLMGVFDTSKMYLEKLGDDNPLLLYLKS
uniref:NR LBD domain-containing protein n=1 Tax=Rhabditophanes sp. KR3021 TaxID=114890 RepID=A0AC35UCY6_9BILA